MPVFAYGSGTARNYPSYSFDAYIMLDHSELNKIEAENNKASVSEIRRSEIGFTARWNKQWKTEIEAGYATPERGEVAKVELKDFTFRYKQDQDYFILFGQFRPDTGLENSISSQNLSLMERSMASQAFRLPRSQGVQFGTYKKYWTSTISYTDASDDNDDVFDIALRGTGAFPSHNNRHFLHLGFNWIQRDWNKGNYRIKEAPEIHTADDLIQSNRIIADSVTTYSTEIGWQWKSYLLLSEWFSQTVTSIESAVQSNAQYDGYYLQFSGLLGAKSRNYKNGRFTRVKGISHIGTLEWVIRYSELDAFDNNTGTIAENITVGLNYIYSNRWKFMTNYVMSNIERPATGFTQEGNAISMRVHFRF